MTHLAGYLTAEQIKQVVPQPTNWIINGVEEVQDRVLPAYDFALPHRYVLFMAQLATESAHFRTLEEYASGADYEGREDLGNTEPGDGVAFKGSGELQRTGRTNTTKSLSYWQEPGRVMAEYADSAEKTPEEWSLCLRDDSRVALEDACLYWTRDRDMHPMADNSVFETALLDVTEAINGGTNGLEGEYGRRDYTHKFGLYWLGYSDLKALQSAHGLAVDGVWGPQSEGAMWLELQMADAISAPETDDTENHLINAIASATAALAGYRAQK